MVTFLIIIHVIVCLALVFVVVIQTSKGGLDSNFGGVATDVLGSAHGAGEFLKKWTKILLVCFVISCICLAFFVKKSAGTSTDVKSILSDEAGKEMQNVPFNPEEMPISDEFNVERSERTPSSPITIELNGE